MVNRILRVGLALLLTAALSGRAPAQQGGTAAPAASASARAPTRRASLTRRLNALLDEPPFDRAIWGVAIADPSGRIVYTRNADRLFIPASVTKILVASAAVALLPPDYRFRTSVYAAGLVDGGVVNGDLVLYGRGDPTLSGRSDDSSSAAFDEMADALRSSGIVRITGDVVGDASYFDSVLVHPSWAGYDLNWWYAAPVTALGFNENSVDFFITPTTPGNPPAISFAPDLGVVRFTNHARTVPADSARTFDFHRAPGTNTIWTAGDVPADVRPWAEHVAVWDAPAWAAAALRRSLEQRGIVVDGRAGTTYDSAAYAAARRAAPLAEHWSVPLPDILGPVLESSQNWFAELLLKTLGREFLGVGSFAAGIAVERRFLIDALGVDSTAFAVVDGSGLSASDLATPRALVQVLRAMRRRPGAEAFVRALPLGGHSGTLRHRFRDPPLEGRVRAKTGSIDRVNTLAGYLEQGGGRTWTFAIQLNHHTALNRDALRRIDAVVAELAR
jgi:D-alanyl-D-alanine carboxypeptidase/D-alanyl-D-alanine-endopeptidase (penicillin-binding protein 4)